MEIISNPVSLGGINNGIQIVLAREDIKRFPADVIGDSKPAPKKMTLHLHGWKPIETDIFEGPCRLRNTRSKSLALHFTEKLHLCEGDRFKIEFPDDPYVGYISIIKSVGGHKTTTAFNGKSIKAILDGRGDYSLTHTDPTDKVMCYRCINGKTIGFSPINATKATLYIATEPPIELGLRPPVLYDEENNHTTALLRTNLCVPVLGKIFKQQVSDELELKKLLDWYAGY